MVVTSSPQSQHEHHSHAPGELGGVPGEGVAGVVGELAAAAQGEGLDVRAVAGEDQEGVVTNILIMTAMTMSKGPFTNDVSIFWGLCHPLVLMSAYHQLLACPLVLQIDDVICEQPEPKTIIFRIQFISIRVNRIRIQLSLVRPTKA